MCEPGGVTELGDERGPTDLGDARQAARQTARIDLRIRVLAFGRMRCKFVLDRAQQPDLGRDLGGDVSECDRGMAGVELDRSVRSSEPFVCTFDPIVILRRLDDHRRDALSARSDQHVRVSPAFQHREVGVGDLARQRTHRHHLADQRLDPRLVQRALTSQPVRSTNPPIQRGSIRARAARAAARLRDGTAGSAPACPHRCHWSWRGGTNTDAGPPTRVELTRYTT